MLRTSEEVKAQTKLYTFDGDLLTEDPQGLGSPDINKSKSASSACSLKCHALIKVELMQS